MAKPQGCIRVKAEQVAPSHERLCTVKDPDELFQRIACTPPSGSRTRTLEATSADYTPAEDLAQEPFLKSWQSKHPLISAALIAFKRHLPLAIYPDAIWASILHGLAHHVYNYVPAGEGNPVTGKGHKIRLEVS
jgi:hypothetical protein